VEKKMIFILGTGPYAVDIADVAGEIPGIQVAGFVESLDRARCAGLLEGLPVLWVEELPEHTATHQFVCAIGTTQRSGFIRQAEGLGCRFATLVHPSGRVSAKSTLGPGCVLNVGVYLAAHSQLGAHVSVNRAATIGHHTTVGDFCTIGPGANIAGNCELGAGCYIGIGATVIDHVRIGAGTVVGAGAVVTEDLPERVLAVGVPARVIKRDIAGL
jgi:acetyltransferase EpsM